MRPRIPIEAQFRGRGLPRCAAPLCGKTIHDFGTSYFVTRAGCTACFCDHACYLVGIQQLLDQQRAGSAVKEQNLLGKLGYLG